MTTKYYANYYIRLTITPDCKRVFITQFTNKILYLRHVQSNIDTSQYLESLLQKIIHNKQYFAILKVPVNIFYTKKVHVSKNIKFDSKVPKYLSKYLVDYLNVLHREGILNNRVTMKNLNSLIKSYIIYSNG